MTCRFLLSVALICLAARTNFAQELPVSRPAEAGFSAAELARVGDIMQRRVDERKIAGGVVAIARRGKLVFLKAFDRQDSELMNTDSIFRLYSMSKAITTAASMILVDERVLALDDPVSKYLSEIANWKVKTPNGLIQPKRPITIKDLMLHTSGMANNDAYAGIKRWKAKDATELMKAFMSVPLAHHPGDEWVYSHSVDILGLVIEKASGKSLADFLEERLLDPLEMQDTAFFVPSEKSGRFAGVYRRTDTNGPNGVISSLRGPIEEEMEEAVTQFLSRPKAPLGGIGLVGTAKDYLRFLLMIANRGEWNGRRYLSQDSVRLMTTNQLPEGLYPISTGVERFGIGFGCGFSVAIAKENWEVDSPVGEFSWGGAASTHCWVSPHDDLIVVTMEQIFPTNRETRRELRPIIYEAIER